MAYQYAIVDHLLGAAKHLVQASLKQLGSTRFDDISMLTWLQVEALLVKQEFLSPPAQQMLLLIQKGDWMDWIKLQQQADFSVIARTQEQSQQLIISHSEGDLTNPDHWPVARWLKDLQSLQTAISDSMQEC